MEAGIRIARNMGTRRYSGVVRNGRYLRNSRRVKRQHRPNKRAKTTAAIWQSLLRINAGNTFSEYYLTRWNCCDLSESKYYYTC